MKKLMGTIRGREFNVRKILTNRKIVPHNFIFLILIALITLFLPEIALSNDTTTISCYSETISAGSNHNCGIQANGTLACWGDDYYFQSSPPSGTFTQVSAGINHTCGVQTNGTLACWGNNYLGKAEPPAGTFTQVSSGGTHTCGVKVNGSVACWGYNGSEQADPPPGTFMHVSAGDWHTCGVKADGTIVCWGDNESGQAAPPTGTFIQVSAGGSHTCGVKVNGSVACWGNDDTLQSTPPPGTFTQVSAGGAHTCGVQTNGTVTCWGFNYHHQADDRPTTEIYAAVSAGDNHTCGQKIDGSVVCWGLSSSLQTYPPEDLLLIDLGLICPEDSCPDDPTKIEPGVCGCGVPDTDSDEDGTLDCLDSDDDNDGIADENDNFPNVPIIPGDINNDGSINLTDTLLSIQLTSNITPSVPVFKEADIDANGMRIGLEEAINALQTTSEIRPQPDDNAFISSQRTGMEAIK